MESSSTIARRKLQTFASTTEDTLANLQLKTIVKESPVYSFSQKTVPIFKFESAPFPDSHQTQAQGQQINWSIPRTVAQPPQKIRRTSQELDGSPTVQVNHSGERLALPHHICRKAAIKRITPDTLVRLINGEFEKNIDSYQIIDCRFSYEFDGGHIKDAVNFDEEFKMLSHFMPENLDAPSDLRQALVFHCEHSQCRAPSFVEHLRQKDRRMNQLTYPTLNFPEVYVLDGGYKNFYEQHSEHCVGGYVSMSSEDHDAQRRAEKSKRQGSYVGKKLTSKSFVNQESVAVKRKFNSFQVQPTAKQPQEDSTFKDIFALQFKPKTWSRR